MDERHLRAARAGARLLVEERRALRLERRHRLRDVRHLQADVVEPLASLLDRLRHRAVRSGGGDELDAPAAVTEDRDAHLLGGHLLDLGELEAVDVAEQLHRGVEVGDEDGDVVEAVHAELPAAGDRHPTWSWSWSWSWTSTWSSSSSSTNRDDGRGLSRGRSPRPGPGPGPREALPSLHLADLHREHLHRAEKADRVYLRAGSERHVGRVGDRLTERGIEGDPLARAADFRPGVPVERGLPVPVLRVDETVNRTRRDPQGARERHEEHGVLGAVALARLEDLARAVVARAVDLLQPAVDVLGEPACGLVGALRIARDLSRQCRDAGRVPVHLRRHSEILLGRARARPREEVDLVETAGGLLRLGTRDDRVAEPDLDDAAVVRDAVLGRDAVARLGLRDDRDLLGDARAGDGLAAHELVAHLAHAQLLEIDLPPDDGAAASRGEPRSVGELRRLADVLDVALLSRGAGDERHPAGRLLAAPRHGAVPAVALPGGAEGEQPAAGARRPDPLLLLPALHLVASHGGADEHLGSADEHVLPVAQLAVELRPRPAGLLAHEVEPEPLRPFRALHAEDVGERARAGGERSLRRAAWRLRGALLGAAGERQDDSEGEGDPSHGLWFPRGDARFYQKLAFETRHATIPPNGRDLDRPRRRRGRGRRRQRANGRGHEHGAHVRDAGGQVRPRARRRNGA